MKKIQTLIAIIMIAMLYPFAGSAQLFKSLQSLARAKSAQAVNAKDSAALAQSKYKNLQSMNTADTTKKGSMRGMSRQISVSPADSAAAIKSFMTASGGSGIVYQ